MKKQLRHGYTTGTCAAAAAKGATLMLTGQEEVSEVVIHLPSGVSATFRLHGQRFSGSEASCFVVKDAGDDPDITNGAELHATVTKHPVLSGATAGEVPIIIEGGTGIGKATKPGLAVAPGEWAINPVPRRMIGEAIREALSSPGSGHDTPFSIRAIISIPDGLLRAQKTLNARLGILGGLSILGTTGIVRPLSAAAWTDTIDAALDVARACGCVNVVLSTGRSSELAARHHLTREASCLATGKPDLLPEEAFIMMGDHVAHALRSSAQRGFMQPFVACQFAKLLKIACGHENTHAAASEMDLSRLMAWTDAAGLSGIMGRTMAPANTAREIVIATNFDPALLNLVCHQAADAAQQHVPEMAPCFLLADYNGAIAFHSPQQSP